MALLTRSTVLVLAILLSAAVQLAECAPSGPHRAGYVCSLCPPGYQVDTPCDQSRDTVCKPCRPGYHSVTEGASQRCYPCSRCGEDLFELYTCNATHDVFCELCAWSEALDNKDYLEKCLASSGTDEPRVEGAKILLGPRGIEVSDLKNAPYLLMLGDGPPGTEHRSRKSDNEEIKEKADWRSDAEQPHESRTALGEKDDGKLSRGAISEAKQPSDNTHVPEAKQPLDDTGMVESPGKIDEGGAPDTGAGHNKAPNVESKSGTLQKEKETLGDQTSVNKTSTRDGPRESLGEPDAEGSGEVEVDLTKPLFTVFVNQTQMPGNRSLTLHTYRTSSKSTGTGSGPFTQTPGGKSAHASTQPSDPKSNTTQTRNAESLLPAPFLRSRPTQDKVDHDPVVKESREAGSQTFPIIMAALTAGIIFFAVGFFLNRFHRNKTVYVPSPAKMKVLNTQPPEVTADPAPEVTVTVHSPHDNSSEEDGITPKTALLQHVAPPRVPSQEATHSGKYPSPIVIRPEDAQLDAELARWRLQYLYVPENSKTATNTGTTVKINVDSRGSVFQGGPLRETRYCLDHIDFRWGAVNSRGSEHTVNDRPYSGEIQLVHWNAEAFHNYQEASRSGKGLAILAIFMEVIKEDHPGLQTIVDVLDSIRYKGETVEVPHHFLDPTALLPRNMMDYWTYPGSLTSPPYDEMVTWVVMKEPIKVAQRQMTKFRSLFKHERDESHVLDGREQERLVDNYRESRPLGNRTVKASSNFY